MRREFRECSEECSARAVHVCSFLELPFSNRCWDLLCRVCAEEVFLKVAEVAVGLISAVWALVSVGGVRCRCVLLPSSD